MNIGTRFKTITFGREDDLGDLETYLVVPEHVTAQEIIACEMSDDPDDYYDCVCECPTAEGAELITKLLNKHYGEN